MPIRKLPTLLINQIAAGEVIERPASVVKELVENALDAGATRVDVHVEDGGRQLIRISDNGGGIAPDELPLAIAPHATSKLQVVEQLAAIETLGFRGEALASIASVSRMRITSRHSSISEHGEVIVADAGSVIEASGDQVSDIAPTACAPGTVIEVRDLFFNTPARRRFMRPAPTEVGHISDMITRIAMVHHGVGFTMRHGERKTIDVPPDQNRRQRCVDLLGRELEDGLMEFEDVHHEQVDDGAAQPQPIRLWGLAGLPAIARATSKFQYVCLNGRTIKDRGVAHAIKEAYRGLIPPDRQPVAVVYIDMDPAMVDVNVHPTKAEVRFRNPSRIHGIVLSALRQRLLGSDLTPSVGISTLNPDDQPTPSVNIESTNDFVDYFKNMPTTQKGFVFEQVKQALAEEDPNAIASDDQPLLTQTPTQTSQILQVHKSYLVTQDQHGIVIIDQHALHERVMFEELRQRVLGDGDSEKKLESQRLLMPAVVGSTSKRNALLEPLRGLLERIGVEAEPIGPDTIGVQAFPTFLFDRKVDPVDFMEELLDRVDEGSIDVSSDTALEAALHEVLDMMACKAAVKAGDQMSDGELAALLEKRQEIERASNCPHGRPTTVRLSIKDLEKQFGR